MDLFKVLATSEIGKSLVLYLEEELNSLFDPKTLTVQNLEPRQEAERWIREKILNPIKTVAPGKENKYQFE